MSRVSDEMSNLGAEVFPDGPTHVMNQIHQVLLHGEKKQTNINIVVQTDIVAIDKNIES